MNNLVTLLIGEFQRLKKYNLIAASILISIIWLGFLHFLEIEDLTNLFPLFIFLDATSMAMLMIGVAMFFEKQEGVLKTLFVSPISKAEYIVAKTIANISLNVLTLVILYVYAVSFKTVEVNIIALILYVFLVGFFHSMLGFILTYYSKDFTDVLMGMLKYSFILIIPVVLYELNVIKGNIIETILLFLPTQHAMNLFTSTAIKLDTLDYIISLVYMLIGSIALYYIADKKFDQFAIKESGV